MRLLLYIITDSKTNDVDVRFSSVNSQMKFQSHQGKNSNFICYGFVGVHLHRYFTAQIAAYRKAPIFKKNTSVRTQNKNA